MVVYLTVVDGTAVEDNVGFIDVPVAVTEARIDDLPHSRQAR